VSWELALDVPEEETGNMEVDAAPLRVTVLDRSLALGHGLLAGVASLPIARPAPIPEDGVVWQTARGELFLDEQTNERLGHEDLPERPDFDDATITGVSAAEPLT
jgi:hypothetical protein